MHCRRVEGDEADTAELQVIVFKNHPLWKKKVDDDIKRVVSTSDAIIVFWLRSWSLIHPKHLRLGMNGYLNELRK